MEDTTESKDQDKQGVAMCIQLLNMNATIAGLAQAGEYSDTTASNSSVAKRGRFVIKDTYYVVPRFSSFKEAHQILLASTPPPPLLLSREQIKPCLENQRSQEQIQVLPIETNLIDTQIPKDPSLIMGDSPPSIYGIGSQPKILSQRFPNQDEHPPSGQFTQLLLPPSTSYSLSRTPMFMAQAKKMDQESVARSIHRRKVQKGGRGHRREETGERYRQHMVSMLQEWKEVMKVQSKMILQGHVSVVEGIAEKVGRGVE